MQTVQVAPAESRSMSRALASAGIFLGACVLGFLVAYSSRFYYQAILRAFNITRPVQQDIAFFSYLILLGLLITIWRPRLFGWQIGRTLAEWKLGLGVLAFLVITEVGYILLAGSTPYSGGLARFWPNPVMVPLGEETFFRGVIFVTVLAFFRRFYPAERAMWLAIATSAISFGFAHANNLFFNPIPFTLFQIAYGTIYGFAFSLVRARTESLIGPILLHGLMNLIAIVM